MEVTHDGKIVIPTEIQEQLGLLPGTENQQLRRKRTEYETATF